MTLEIIGRRQWGARYAKGFGAAPLPAREVWLHHTATRTAGPAAEFAEDAATIRLLDQIGQDRFGGGISYTFLVTETGRVWEGHGVDRRGAHTKGHNTIGRAVALVGNYEARQPAPTQITAVVRLLRHGHQAGWWVAPRLAGGHRDAPGAATACPGQQAYVLIAEINRRARQEEDG